MFKRTSIAVLTAVACSLGTVAMAGIAESGFEASEGFTTGSSVDGVGGWILENSGLTGVSATVMTSGGAAAGAQYAQLSDGAVLNYGLDAAQRTWAGSTVWVEGYFRGAGSQSSLADSLNLYADDASAIVHFSSTSGIEMLNGDGAGGGTAQTTSITSISSGSWYKITIQLDFSAHTWNLWINDEKQNTSPLGFRNSAVSQLNGFKNLAQTQSDFDGFRVVRSQAGDANGDSRIDSADLARLIDYAADSSSADAIAFSNGNIATQGASADAIDGDDVALLWAKLVGSTM